MCGVGYAMVDVAPDDTVLTCFFCKSSLLSHSILAAASYIFVLLNSLLPVSGRGEFFPIFVHTFLRIVHRIRKCVVLMSKKPRIFKLFSVHVKRFRQPNPPLFQKISHLRRCKRLCGHRIWELIEDTTTAAEDETSFWKKIQISMHYKVLDEAWLFCFLLFSF